MNQNGCLKNVHSLFVFFYDEKRFGRRRTAQRPPIKKQAPPQMTHHLHPPPLRVSLAVEHLKLMTVDEKNHSISEMLQAEPVMVIKEEVPFGGL